MSSLLSGSWWLWLPWVRQAGKGQVAVGASGMKQGPRSRGTSRCVPCASASRVMLSGGAGALPPLSSFPW